MQIPTYRPLLSFFLFSYSTSNRTIKLQFSFSILYRYKKIFLLINNIAALFIQISRALLPRQRNYKQKRAIQLVIYRRWWREGGGEVIEIIFRERGKTRN